MSEGSTLWYVDLLIIEGSGGGCRRLCPNILVAVTISGSSNRSIEKNRDILDLNLIFRPLVSGRGAATIARTSANISEHVSCCHFINRGHGEDAGIIVNWAIVAVVAVLTQLVPFVPPGHQVGEKIFARIHRAGL